MRCNNCGWENPDNNSRCEKCNSPLQGNDNPYLYSSPAQPNLNKTVSEADAFPQTPVQNNNCPNCGYPLRPNVQICPNCGTNNANPTHASQQPQAQQQPHIHQQPISGTVNPWQQVSKQCQCTLTPIQHDTENTPPAPQQFKGTTHQLSRQNLDPDNFTITSKLQASLTFENGQWFLQDLSTQHTTFIQVKAKTQLHSGDIILMGNRQFIFEEK